MIRQILSSFAAFQEMLLVTSALGNTLGEESDEDQKKIIRFIGKAYGYKKDLIDCCEKLILEDLSAIGTESDIGGYYSMFNADKVDPAMVPFYQAKVNALNTLMKITNEKHRYGVNKEWFVYDRRKPYFAPMRFKEIITAARCGIVICNRIAGILEYLGIGVDANPEGGITRLLQCSYWGDEKSFPLLAFIYKEQGKEEEAALYQKMVDLTPRLLRGGTILTKEEEEKEDVRNLFALIASIFHDIVLAFERFDIDYSFTEIMMMDDLDYYAKMKHVNSYRQGEWRDISNPTNNPKKRFGFIIGGDEQ